MAEKIEDLTVTYVEDDIEILKELDKEILTSGAWSTIIYKYREWDRQKKTYSDDRYTIRRYRKMQGVFRQQSKFNISNKAQAEKIIAVLQKWIAE